LPGYFPHFSDETAFQIWRADTRHWAHLVAGLVESEKLGRGEIAPFAEGSNLVAALGDGLIVKLFAPFHRAQFICERAALAQLRGRTEIAIPEIVAEGELETWPYLVITRLPGAACSTVWDGLDASDQARIMRELGEAIVQVHAAPPGPLADLGAAWPDFMAAQIAGCVTRHRRLGLPERFAADVAALMMQAPTLIPMQAQPVILGGDFLPENLMLDEKDGRLGLSGLIDFGDAMTGWKEYDLLAPTAFFTAGRPALTRSLLTGFGYRPDEMDGAFRRRLLILSLLHRESDLALIDLDSWQNSLENLTDLEDLAWSIT
jgi:hygromycin-B 7''-O-kinase